MIRIEHLEAVVGARDIAISIRDKNNMYVYVSVNYMRIFNVALTDIIGHTPEEVYPKSDVEMLARRDAEAEDISRGNYTISVDSRHDHNGELHTFISTRVRMDLSGLGGESPYLINLVKQVDNAGPTEKEMAEVELKAAMLWLWSDRSEG